MLNQDLYRLGNANSPKLDNVRNKDVDTYSHPTTLMVVANGKGISLLDEARLSDTRGYTGWVWKIPSMTPLPQGLTISPDLDLDPRKRGHFLLCPVSDMTMDKYRALLLELALRCKRIRQL